jgi:hypothetical protein
MREFDWDLIRRQKDAYRDSAAALPLGDKLRVLERLRDRALAMRSPHDRSMNAVPIARTTVSMVSAPMRPVANMGKAVLNVSMFGASATFAAAIAQAHTGSATTTTLPSSRDIDPDL